MPKGVLGIRVFNQNFKELRTTRSLSGIRLMYGITPKLSLFVTNSMSNHHSDKLPKDLLTHTHIGNQTIYYAQSIKRGQIYPNLYNGLHVFAKYRFLTIDDRNEHFRMAGYGEWSNVSGAHDEAEPNLMDDTGGYGFGIISTLLKNKFAASLTVGLIRPNSYGEMQPDVAGGSDLPTRINYGNAIKYNLSFGYLLAPTKYNDYNQPNWNVYLEFIGKSYEGAHVVQNGVEIKEKTSPLQRGSFVEVHPGIQRIMNSNLRIDFSMGSTLFGNSYVHVTPVWTIAIQRYFYR